MDGRWGRAAGAALIGALLVAAPASAGTGLSVSEVSSLTGAKGVLRGKVVNDTGRAQAVMAHTNVGLANCAIGAINAAMEHVPVLLFSGRTPVTERGRKGSRTVPIGWGQEMRDQAALVREACKWDDELRFPEHIPQMVDRAHAIATSTPRGPVYMSLPREVLCQPGRASWPSSHAGSGRRRAIPSRMRAVRLGARLDTRIAALA